MLTFYHHAHIRHDPGVLLQPEGGSHAYYSEVAERGLILRRAMESASVGPILAPRDFGMAPLQSVHSHELLTLLQAAYDRMVDEVHGGAHHPRVVLPETFAVRLRRDHSPRSIWAHLGFHCYDTSSPIFVDTWQAVYWSAQTALSAAASVADGQPVAYALCRPPGHHASSDMFGGFCYVNNLAIAAQWLVERGQRVAILDIDYHHGNGTQEIFYQRDDVLTVSLHADPHVEYPFFWGHEEERGAGVGLGFNVNLALPKGTDTIAYLTVLDGALYRIHQFAPDTLLVSLGLDTYKDDPVGGFALETESYTAIGRRLAGLGMPMVVVQEGGYYLPALADNLVAFFGGLLAVRAE